jgi:hypothetical protein
MEPRETRVLGYEGRGGRRRYFDDRRANAVAICVVAGIVVTIPAMVLAVMSMASDDGVFARLLFPAAGCAAVFVASPNAPSASIVLAVVQFPLYGGVIGYYATSSRKALRIAVGVVLLIHFLAFVVCLR